MKNLITTAIILGSLLPFMVKGQESEYQKLTASEAEEDAWFGYSIDLYGDFLMIGARNENVSEVGAENDEGAIYFFQRQEDGLWEESQRLFVADPYGFDDYLGHSVALSENYAIASAPINIGESFSTGRYPYAIIYKKENDLWVQADSITASDIDEPDDFGESVAINEDWAFVGNDDGEKVYIYQRQSDGSWNETQIIEESISSSFGGRLAIGSGYFVASGTIDQEVWTYAYNEVSELWEETDELDLGYTMWDLDVLDSIMVVGNISDTENGSGSGAINVYLLGSDGTWSFSEKLLSPDGASNDRFGYSVAIDTNHIIASTRETNKAYSFEKALDNTFTYKKTLQLQSAEEHEVAVFDEDVAIADWYRNENSISESGATYMYFSGDNDKFGPSVTSFTFFDTPTSSSTSLIYDLYFDEDVTGVSADDFYFDVSVGKIDGTITTVAALSATNYRLLATVSGDGFYSLTINDDSDIIDSSGNQVISSSSQSVVMYTSTESISHDLPVSAPTLDQSFDHPLETDQAFDLFGNGVDISGNLAIAGAYGYNVEQGAVFTFENDGSSWSYANQLTSFLTTTTTAKVGWSVALSGNFIFAGAPEDTYDSKSNHGGVVYWYDGSEKAPIRGDNGAADNYRGRYLSSSDSYLLFSSESELVDGFSSGAAYLYALESDGSVTYEATLKPSNPENSMAFSTALAITDEYAVIGAKSSSQFVSFGGAAYVFKRMENGDWEEHQILSPSNYNSSSSTFGSSVAIDGKTMAVGAQSNNLEYLNYSGGAVYIYTLNDEGIWEEEAKLYASDGSASDRFGSRVEVSGGIVLVQADGYESGTFSSQGNVYAFGKEADGNWQELSSFTTGVTGDAFGRSIAFDGLTGIIGTSASDNEGSASGKIDFFTFGSSDYNIWDGASWSDGTSNITDKAYFIDDYPFTTDEELEVAEVYVSGSTDFNVDNNATLIVTDTVRNNGSITFSSGSSLVTQGDVAFLGNDLQFDRETTFNDITGNYSVVGSPVEDASFSSLGSAALVYAYDESEAYNISGNVGLDRYKTPDELNHDSMQSGAGYFSAFTGDENGLISFSGKPNTGDIDVNLTKTDHPTDEDSFEGFNLIANPFPCGISYDDIVDTYPSLLEGEIYLWDDGGSNTGRRNASDYVTVTKSGAVGGSGDNGKSVTNNRTIASMQGFFVQAKSAGTLTFTDDMKVSGDNSDDGFFRSTPQPELRLALQNDDYYNETMVSFSENATEGIDYAYDGRKLKSNDKLQLYSYINEVPYAIQTLPLSQSLDIGLGVDIGVAGDYVLEVKGLINQEGFSYTLVDNTSKELYDLNLIENLTFKFESGLNQNRFQLLIASPATITSVADEELNQITFKYLNSHVLLSSNTINKANVSAYNLSGQVLFSEQTDFSTGELIIPFDNIGEVFILSVAHDNGTSSRKIFIKE